MELIPEVLALLEHLVLNFGLDRFASASDLAARLNLGPAELNNAVDELELKKLVHVQRAASTHPYTFKGVAPKALTWLLIEPDRLGFDPEEDMRVIAKCVRDSQRVSYDDLVDKISSSDRMEIAALILERKDAVKLGPKPYMGRRFGWAEVTAYTEKWLREQEEN